MELELKTLLKTLDFSEDIKDIESFKKTFNEKFIPKSQIFEDDAVKDKIAAATGKATGAFATFLKRELDLSSDEIKDKKWEDIATLGITKVKSKIKELEDTMTSGGDEKVKTLTAKLEKREKDYTDLKSLLDTTKDAISKKDDELAKKDAEYGTKFKEYKAVNVIDKAKEKVMPKLKSDLSEADRFYFDSKIKDSFVIDFDEKDEPIVLGKDGKRIQNPSKVGTFVSVEEALELKAAELKLIKQNNGGSGIDPSKLFNKDKEMELQKQQAASGVKPRIVHPSALKHAESLKAHVSK